MDLKDLPGFDDWVEMQKPAMSEETARSYGEVHANLVKGTKVTRQLNFELCDQMVVFLRRVEERKRDERERATADAATVTDAPSEGRNSEQRPPIGRARQLH